MPVQHNPFLDSRLVRGTLYATAERLALRTAALHRAKIAGRDAGEVITDLAADVGMAGSDITAVDIGCGRGSTTRALAEHLAPARLIALDLSPAVITAARRRLQPHGGSVRFVCADYHQLPFADSSCQLIVAAFCLYHSPCPPAVLAEIARCLSTNGAAILATKSADSYHELDELIEASGLDSRASARPSLFAAAHSTNLPEFAAEALAVQHTLHEEHRFLFSDLRHVAEYLATSPKYLLPEPLNGDSTALATALRSRLADRAVHATSTVTYVVAGRRTARGPGSDT